MKIVQKQTERKIHTNNRKGSFRIIPSSGILGSVSWVYYRPTLRNNPQDRRIQFNRSGSLQSSKVNTDWLKIKQAVTEEAEERIGYKKSQNRKRLRTLSDEIELAIREEKVSYRKYLQNKTVEHFTEYHKKNNNNEQY
jgi:hypothetical protein